MSKITPYIMSLSRCSALYRSQKLEPLGIKGIHGSYLIQICHNPGISQDQLAKKLFINKSNIARQVAVLEEGGFLQRKPSSVDKRVMELYPTEKAKQILPQVQEVFRQSDRMLTEDLTEDEIRFVTEVLQRMKEKAAAWMEEA